MQNHPLFKYTYVVYIIFGNVKEIKTKDEDILEISLH